MKLICPICKKKKDNIGPKIIGSGKTKDPRFIQEQTYLEIVIMCKDCLNDYKEGKVSITLKSGI